MNNEIHGFGTYSWADEKEYVGEWVSNKMQGQGHLKWPNGKEYKG